jgi:phosphoglycerol transferase
MNVTIFRPMLLASVCGLVLLSGCSGKQGADAPSMSTAAVSDTAASAPAAIAGATDASAPAYDSTLAQGIDFSKTGYPSFLTNMSGLSRAESWGRWTDANLGASAQFHFKNALPQQFKLILEAKDFFGINADQKITVRVGNKQQEFAFNSADKIQHVELTFTDVNTANTIEIIVPKHSEPTAADSRKMGLGLVSLKILP